MNGNGWALTRLQDIHEGIRGDLRRLDDAVRAIARDGKDPAAAMAGLGDLAIRRPGWTLRGYCATVCGIVAEHHAVEDTLLFPGLLERDPDLAGTLDALRAEHRVLTVLVAAMDDALARLPGTAADRDTAVTALRTLADELGSHLEREEKALAPALNALSAAVAEEDFPAPPPPEHWEAG